ncbi:ribonuclease H-like domain-containing protein [Tanacetum coccineum]
MIRGRWRWHIIFEYIDNVSWKVIQNRKLKKRSTPKVKDGVYRVLLLTHQKEQFADEKERKARTLLLKCCSKIHLRVFSGMDDAKRFGQPQDRFGGNANSKKMLKKSCFENISLRHLQSRSKECWRRKDMIGFQKTPITVGALVLVYCVQLKKANHSFCRVPYSAWDSLAMTMRTKKNIDTLSIDDLYNNLSVFEQDIQKTSSSSLSSDNGYGYKLADCYDCIKIRCLPEAGRRPRVDGKMHVAFDKRKVECFNCHNTGHFARECKFKGSKEGNRQEAGQINWVELTTVRNSNHALMAFTVNNELGLGHSIKSNAEVLGYEEEMSRGIFVLRETDEGYYDIPLYSRFKQEDIDDSLYEYVSNASSIVFSICPSNDSDGELGIVTDHSVNDDLVHDQIPIPSIEQATIVTQKTQPQVPKPTQTVDPSCAQHVKSPRQPIRTPVTSSPIPANNRQNWNQQMERELGA